MKKPIIAFRVQNYYFSAAILPIFTVLTLFLLLISLGIWQIQRGNEKKMTQVSLAQQQHAAPIDLNQISTFCIKPNYSPALATGHFDNRHNFLLDNKHYNHRIGYEVLTPFIFKNNTYPILVNRGWIPRGSNRQVLPFIKAINGNISIEGALVWPVKTFSFNSPSENKWPQRIQTIDPKFLSQQHLQPFIFIVDKRQLYGFIPPWRASTLRASQHYAYAFQWFSLGITLLVAFCVSHLTHSHNSVKN